jgi:hypothetical protein
MKYDEAARSQGRAEELLNFPCLPSPSKCTDVDSCPLPAPVNSISECPTPLTEPVAADSKSPLRASNGTNVTDSSAVLGRALSSSSVPTVVAIDTPLVGDGSESERRRKYRGVILRKGKYVARCYINGSPQMLGLFDTALEAAMKYDEAARSQGRAEELLNFPCLPALPTCTEMNMNMPSLQKTALDLNVEQKRKIRDWDMHIWKNGSSALGNASCTKRVCIE